MILTPNSLAIGDRVRHDLTGRVGTVTELLTERGHKGLPVDYARVLFGSGGSPEKRAMATLTKL